MTLCLEPLRPFSLPLDTKWRLRRLDRFRPQPNPKERCLEAFLRMDDAWVGSIDISI